MIGRRALITLGASVFVFASAAAAWIFVESQTVQWTDNAYLRADAAITAPRIEGYLIKVPVRENQKVRAGDVLAELDDRNYRARVDQATADRDALHAQIAGDRATLQSLSSQKALQDSVIAQSKANLAVADAELKRAKLDYDRYKSLSATQASSVQRFETATSARQKAEAEYTRGQAALQAEERRLPLLDAEQTKAQAQLTQSQAALARTEALLALAKNDLDDTKLRAAFAGTVGNLAARLGAFVRPGTALMTVVPKQTYVVANFKETQVRAMRPGQPVTISVDAYPTLMLSGTVESFAPATGSEFSILPPENATGNFTKIVQRVPVRIAIVDEIQDSTLLQAGLSVVVSVDTAAPGCVADKDCMVPPVLENGADQISSHAAGAR